MLRIKLSYLIFVVIAYFLTIEFKMLCGIKLSCYKSTCFLELLPELFELFFRNVFVL